MAKTSFKPSEDNSPLQVQTQEYFKVRRNCQCLFGIFSRKKIELRAVFLIFRLFSLAPPPRSLWEVKGLLLGEVTNIPIFSINFNEIQNTNHLLFGK